MDSVTQLVLGAAVGDAVLGKKVGRRALFWGAAVATLPDLDVFIHFEDPVVSFTYHRGYSHAFFVHLVISPLIAWLILKFHPATAEHKRGWLWLVLLVLITHALLDSFTVYGTQIFLPFSDYPVGLGSIFIIDPVYTLPLLVTAVVGAFMQNVNLRHRFSMTALVVSTAYLLSTVGTQQLVTSKVALMLSKENIEYNHLLVSPSPFDILLWRIVVRQESAYQEGFYSLLDGDTPVRFRRFESEDEVLEQIAEHWPVERLKWFSKGFYSVDQFDNYITISDLRMGMMQHYVFAFNVGKNSDGNVEPIDAQRRPTVRPPLSALGWTWRRIFNPEEALPEL